MFTELKDRELQEIDGGMIGIICAVVGTAIAVGSAIYGYGYACGQRDGYARYE